MINDAKSAHEFANAWIRDATAARAYRAICFALEGQLRILDVLKTREGVERDAHQEAANVLQIYLDDNIFLGVKK